jgi:hypothetical protein
VDLLVLGDNDDRALVRLDGVLLAVEEVRVVHQLALDALLVAEKFHGMLLGHAEEVALVLVPAPRPLDRARARVLDVDFLRLRQRGQQALEGLVAAAAVALREPAPARLGHDEELDAARRLRGALEVLLRALPRRAHELPLLVARQHSHLRTVRGFH